MAKTRDAICGLANTWLGRNEREGTHKEIIDIYNSFAPAIARNYRVKYTDSWCATFISALAIKLGYTGIIPLECSCYYMIEKAKKMGIWYEVDNYHPCNGDIIMYDWQDSGEGDNKGVPDHVGLVVSVNPKDMTFVVIEGNYSNAVKCRTLEFNGKYIRGFIRPKYDDYKPIIDFSTKVEEPKKEVDTSKKKVVNTVDITLKVLKKNSSGKQVKTAQYLLVANGCSVGSSGVDGKYGNDTESAVKKYQEKKKLKVDGVIGEKTWTSLLK